MKTLMIAALLGTVAAGGVAVAQATTAPAAKPMHGDANGDGKLTRAEFLRQAETRFVALDSNKDGALTRDEARPGRGHGGDRGRPVAFGAMGQDGAPPPPAGTMGAPRGPRGGMARLDVDGDGRVTRAEFSAQSAKRFARMDANGDGTVDQAEIAALPRGGQMATRADTNGDGALSRAELDAQAGQQFARMDGNGDGVIDAAEMQAGPMTRGDRGQGARRNRAPAIPPAAPAPAGA